MNLKILIITVLTALISTSIFGSDFEKPFMTKEMLANKISTNEYQLFYLKSLDIPLDGLQKKIVYEGKASGYFDFINGEHKEALTLSNATIINSVNTGVDSAKDSAKHTISGVTIGSEALKGAGMGLVTNLLVNAFLGNKQYIQVADYSDGKSIKNRVTKYIISDGGLSDDDLKMIYDASMERSYHFNRGKASSLLSFESYFKSAKTYNDTQDQASTDNVPNYQLFKLETLKTNNVVIEKVDQSGTTYKVKNTMKAPATPAICQYIITAALQKAIEHAKNNRYEYIQIVSPDSLSNEKGFPINNFADIVSYLVPMANNPGGYLRLDNSLDLHSSIEKSFGPFGSPSFEIVFKEVKNPKHTDIVWDTKSY
jgi:hypothetical protein